jgi:hypothetical protein
MTVKFELMGTTFTASREVQAAINGVLVETTATALMMTVVTETIPKMTTRKK